MAKKISEEINKIKNDINIEINAIKAEEKKIVNKVKAEVSKAKTTVVKEEIVVKSTWEKIKIWLKSNWMIIVNYLIIFITYSSIYGHAGFVLIETMLGLWLFASAAIGAFKWFKSK